eukprot:g4821.t1
MSGGSRWVVEVVVVVRRDTAVVHAHVFFVTHPLVSANSPKIERDEAGRPGHLRATAFFKVSDTADSGWRSEVCSGTRPAWSCRVVTLMVVMVLALPEPGSDWTDQYRSAWLPSFPYLLLVLRLLVLRKSSLF